MLRSLPRAQDVKRLLRFAGSLELSSSAITRLKWFLFCSEHGDNVSLTCRHFGISRSTFLRWANRFDASDTKTLEEESRRPKTVREPETDTKVIELIAAIRKENPEMGKEPITAVLREKHNIEISSSTVGRIITRHGLYFGSSESHRMKRERAEEKETDTATETVLTTIINQKPTETDGLDTPSLFPVPGLTS